MKKILALLLAVLTIFAMVSCADFMGKDDDEPVVAKDLVTFEVKTQVKYVAYNNLATTAPEKAKGASYKDGGKIVNANKDGSYTIFAEDLKATDAELNKVPTEIKANGQADELICYVTPKWNGSEKPVSFTWYHNENDKDKMVVFTDTGHSDGVWEYNEDGNIDGFFGQGFGKALCKNRPITYILEVRTKNGTYSFPVVLNVVGGTN